MQAYSIQEYYWKQTPNQIFKGGLKTFWKSSVMELIFSKFLAYKLQPLALHILRIPENLWDIVCCGVPFYRSRCVQVLYRKTALKSFLRSSQVYLKRTPTWTFYWEVAKKIPGGYFFQKANGQVLLEIQTSICLEHQWTPLNGWEENCIEMSNCIKVILMPNN